MTIKHALLLTFSTLLSQQTVSMSYASAEEIAPVSRRSLVHADPNILELMMRFFATHGDELSRVKQDNPEELERLTQHFAKQIPMTPVEFTAVSNVALVMRRSIADIDKEGARIAETAFKAGRLPDHGRLVALESQRADHINRAVTSIHASLSTPGYDALNTWFWGTFCKSVQRRPLK